MGKIVLIILILIKSKKRKFNFNCKFMHKKKFQLQNIKKGKSEYKQQRIGQTIWVHFGKNIHKKICEKKYFFFQLETTFKHQKNHYHHQHRHHHYHQNSIIWRHFLFHPLFPFNYFFLFLPPISSKKKINA